MRKSQKELIVTTETKEPYRFKVEIELPDGGIVIDIMYSEGLDDFLKQVADKYPKGRIVSYVGG